MIGDFFFVDHINFFLDYIKSGYIIMLCQKDCIRQTNITYSGNSNFLMFHLFSNININQFSELLKGKCLFIEYHIITKS